MLVFSGRMRAVSCRRLCKMRNKANIVSSVMASHCMFSTKDPPSARIVYHSLSKNIFANLAFEEWLYESADISNKDVLLVWRNEPSVVIGRHQNPWMEANVPLLEKESVCLARRASGGGAVYHDQGNLNLSFLKNRKRYDRKENLALVVNALTSKWDIDLSINERDDIILDGVHKVSGTAAKLSRDKSYHHFTLLHSVERSKLSEMLSSRFKQDVGPDQKDQVSINSRSTKSVPSPVQNLQSRVPEMTFDLMMDAIIGKFFEDSSITPERHTVPDPLDERLYPGVSDINRRLQSWEWLYGKTPKFSLELDLTSEDNHGANAVRRIDVTVEKGCLVTFTIGLSDETVIDLAYVANFKGMEMRRENLKFFTNPNFLFGNSFSNAYPRLDVNVMSKSVQESLPKLFNFL